MTPGRGKRLFLLVLCGGFVLLFGALGVWQVERRAWKHDLIARTEARVSAAPVAVPERAAWRRLDPQAVEYLRVRASGRFDHQRTTYVDALTELGAGNWVLTPLATASGTILINRGFAPKGWQAAPVRADAVTVTGLLRLSEPDGRILRPNEPAAERWFSRDVAAIAAARRLTDVAPFFIDAEREATSRNPPVGGLTVVRFANNHLLYAITWFALSALSFGGLVLVLRSPHTGG